MIYYAKITKQEDKTYLVEFPELEGCFTEAESVIQAKASAKEALNGWLASNCDRSLKIPEPKKRRGKNFYAIEVDVRVSFPVMLRRLRVEKKLSQKRVADKLGISQQAYAKLETPLKANPSLSTVQNIAHAFNREFEFSLVA